MINKDQWGSILGFLQENTTKHQLETYDEYSSCCKNQLIYICFLPLLGPVIIDEFVHWYKSDTQ